MKLNDRLLNAYEYNGIEYRIDMAFDNVLDIFDVLADDDLSDFDKANLGLLYLFDGEHLDPERATIAPEDAIETWNDIFENYISVADKEVVDYDLQGNPMPKKATKKLIDIEKDAEFIYSSFRQAYRIDLFDEQGKMHWHKFQALLNGLPENTIFKRIIQIRAWEPSKHESKEYKKSMSELQEIYSLEDDQEEVE